MSYGAHASCTATRRRRQDPGGVHALDPAPIVHGDQRVLTGGRRVHPPHLALTRSPVSSKFTTSAATRWARTHSVPPSPAAAGVIAETVPAETGVPNNSANAAAVCLRDRNCPN